MARLETTPEKQWPVTSRSLLIEPHWKSHYMASYLQEKHVNPTGPVASLLRGRPLLLSFSSKGWRKNPLGALIPRPIAL